MEIDFSSEDEEELGGYTVKNMGKLFQEYKPKEKGTFTSSVNWQKYYSKIEKLGNPDHPTVKALEQKYNLHSKYVQEEKAKNDNGFPDF